MLNFFIYVEQKFSLFPGHLFYKEFLMCEILLITLPQLLGAN